MQTICQSLNYRGYLSHIESLNKSIAKTEIMDYFSQEAQVKLSNIHFDQH